ncbi:UNVERIFIED_CONTAM: hypothetical protein Sradi_5085600 [Sesamum radiatum]|uniref:Uncharacterized protein n=1 Tax=Sesamum radiatum TaxID=300843 RepID=A0AAW2M3I9_SESRA
MWIVNDLPAYGVAFGWSSAGIMGCPISMDDTRAFHLQLGRKTCYFDYHRQFLSEDHHYRWNQKVFTKNRVEYKVIHLRLTGEQICDWIVDMSSVVEMSLTLPSSHGSDHK